MKSGKWTNVMITLKHFLACQKYVCYIILQLEFTFHWPTYFAGEAAEKSSILSSFIRSVLFASESRCKWFSCVFCFQPSVADALIFTNYVIREMWKAAVDFTVNCNKLRARKKLLCCIKCNTRRALSCSRHRFHFTLQLDLCGEDHCYESMGGQWILIVKCCVWKKSHDEVGDGLDTWWEWQKYSCVA